VIKVISDSFKSIGYTCEWRVLEAANFGVPQRRERLFIVAFPTGEENFFRWPIATHCQPVSEPGGLFCTSSIKPWVTLWEAISDLPECAAGNAASCLLYRSDPQNAFQTAMRMHAPTEIKNHEPMRHTARILERFSQIKVGQSEADVMGHHIPRRRGAPAEASDKAYSQNSRRQNKDAPCNTIVASSHTNFIHPTLDRNFTVRELMRIQSFPDSYVMFGKRAVLSKKLSIKKGYLDDVYLDQRMQVGNAVPPLLGQAMAYAIKAALLNGKVHSLAA
jgi:DNA (cytosine-5)-methyltransferase 1